MTKQIITTTYNLRIEGYFVSFERCPIFNRPMVNIELKSDYGLRKKGEIIRENYNSCVLKSSLKFNNNGNGYGKMIDWKEPN